MSRELEELRQQVQALRLEIEALKSAWSAAHIPLSPSFPAGGSPANPRAVTAAESHLPAAPNSGGVTSPDPVEVASLTPPAPPSSAPPQAAAPPPSRVKQKPPQGEVQALGDRVTLGGYGSMCFEANDVSAGQFVPSGSRNGFTFRRFVLTTDARLTPRLRIHSETEFERLLEIEVEKRATAEAGDLRFAQETEGNAGGEVSIEQIWGQYNFAQDHGLRFGVVLPPPGRFNILHDNDYWDLPRRTLVDRDAPVVPSPVAWQELGAGLLGNFNLPRDVRLDCQFYVLNGTTLGFDLENVVQTRTRRRHKLDVESQLKLASGAVDGSQGARAVAWRAAFSPTVAGEIAFSGYHGRYTPDFLSAREPLNSLGFDWK